MNTTCYIVDDEYRAIATLADLVSSTPGLELLGSSTDPVEALNCVLQPVRPDIIFLDIEMPQMSGMQFADLVRFSAKVVFTTSYPGYALQAFDKKAFDYLLKPITRERFLQSITDFRRDRLAREESETKAAGHFYIKTGTKGRIVRVDIDEISHVEALSNYVRIQTGTEKHLVYLTLTEVEDLLPKATFVKVHRSYVVNKRTIKAIEPGQVRLAGGFVVPLGRTFKDAFLAGIGELLLKSYRDG